MKKYRWGNITIFAIAILVVSALASWYFFANKTKSDAGKEQPQTKQVVLNKSDYKEESKQALRLLDKFFAQHENWAVEEQSRLESKQHGSSGLTRSMEIRLTEKDNLEVVLEKLKGFAEKNNLKMQAQKEEKTTSANKAISLEIGFETAQGVFVTDKLLFLVANKEKSKKKESAGNGRLALIIDDAGYSLEPLEKMLQIK